MLNARRVASIFSMILIAYAANVALGQSYPTKPIRIVTSEVGGGTEFPARVIAPALSSSLGQQVIVDNRGSGVIPGDIVFRSQPDGYTLLVAAGSIAVMPLLQKIPYDPVKDFAPVSLLVTSPNILVVHPAVPAKSAKELIAYAKTKPGALSYSSSRTGATSHLAAELFKAMAGVDVVRINYKGNALALADLFSGQVQMTFGSAFLAPHIKSGKLRALGIASAQPSALFPGVPTISSTGLPGFEADSIYGMYAPLKTPPAIIKKLNQEVVQILSRPETKEILLGRGVEAVGSTPERLAAEMKSDRDKWGKLIKDLGIREEQ